MLCYIDGFGGEDYDLRWTPNGATALSILSSDSPIHGNYLRFQGNLGASRRLTATQEDDLLIIGGHFRTWSGGLGADGGIFTLGSDAGTTMHTTLGWNTDGRLQVFRGTHLSGGGTSLGSSAVGLISDQTWYHVAFKVLLHDSAGTIDVELDGVNVLTLTGQDTKNGGTKTVFDTFWVRGCQTGGSAAIHFDDIYVANALGTVNNDFLGICRVDHLLPNADSTPEEWDRSTGTDSFALIDEADPNGDTDYISSDVLNEVTQVGFGNLTDLDHEIYGVQLSSYARKDDSGLASYRHAISSDGNVDVGPDRALTEAYVVYADVFELDPDGDIAWTAAQVNAAEARVEVRA